jgi:hypothetical protein
LINRAYSLWSESENWPSIDEAAFDDSIPNGSLVKLNQQPYLSKIWGTRSFFGWFDADAAATHIVAVIRGFLARRQLRSWVWHRYYRVLDPSSGYMYFYDRYALTSNGNGIDESGNESTPFNDGDRDKDENDETAYMTTKTLSASSSSTSTSGGHASRWHKPYLARIQDIPLS